MGGGWVCCKGGGGGDGDGVAETGLCDVNVMWWCGYMGG